MIGKFIKKLWKDWPEYEMTIKAEDLNKWEDAIKEHDDRLEQLKNIDTDLNEANNKIKSLQNAAHASEYANNFVRIEEEAKAIGTIGTEVVYQLGYCEWLVNMNAEGYKTIYPFKALNAYEYYLVDVAASVSDSSNGKVASTNCRCTEPETTKAEVVVTYNSDSHGFTVKWYGFKDNQSKLLTFRIQYITHTL